MTWWRTESNNCRHEPDSFFAVLPDVGSLAALDRISQRLRIAAAHGSSPATPRGIPPGSQKQNKTKNSGMGRDTYSCSDWSQLHEAVRADGADVPGCPGGRVRRGDPRSNQQLGIHSRSTVVNEKRLCVREVDRRGEESL